MPVNFSSANVIGTVLIIGCIFCYALVKIVNGMQHSAYERMRDTRVKHALHADVMLKLHSIAGHKRVG